MHDRKNFVKINLNKMGKYKPALRGAAFQTKVMAKKRNAVRFKNRAQAKIMAERAAQSTGAYGGYGARGLDFGEGAKSNAQDIQESFSGALAEQFAPAVDEDGEEIVEEKKSQEEDELLVGQDDAVELEKEVEEELDQLEAAQVKTNPIAEDDQAFYPIPANDAGYKYVLKEKFGHSEFREGQMEAIKVILEEKKNALVVLATGGGKSLCYQFCSQFLPGLVLVVTPLISLMSDQLQKLPDFIPGASLNSQ